jgi:large subunit ribosomal protein L5
MKEQYSKEVVPALQKEFSYKNIMQVPRIEKITLNMGVGEAVGDKKLIENAVADLERRDARAVAIARFERRDRLGTSLIAWFTLRFPAFVTSGV